jgi:hypothetical protein
MTEQISLPDQRGAMTPEQEAVWRAAPWRLFTICYACGQAAYCVGSRRCSLYCADCFRARRSRRRS